MSKAKEEVTTPQRKIWLVPSPIGNLQDITLRALEVLREADAIACEDTRRTGILLKHFEIHKPLVRLDAHTMGRAASVLQQYPRLAYLSDAGTPAISDPGAELVALAIAEEIAIESLAGPTAFVPAVVLSGLSSARFCFEGFLPRKGRERQERLELIKLRSETTVMYESPQRLRATLQELAQVCGPERPASVTRELSKRFEETVRGSLSELAEHFAGEVRGEICLCVAGRSNAETEQDEQKELAELEGLAQQWQQQGQTVRQIRAALMARGLKKNEAYAMALRLDQAD